MAQLGDWLAEAGHPLHDLRAGGQRLEDVFRRLTGGESMKLTLVQLRAELRRVAGNGEQLLLTLGIPVLLLVFFSLVDVLPTGHQGADRLPRTWHPRLATMSTAMVSLGIGTASNAATTSSSGWARRRWAAAADRRQDRLGDRRRDRAVRRADPGGLPPGWNRLTELVARCASASSSAPWHSPASV